MRPWSARSQAQLAWHSGRAFGLPHLRPALCRRAGSCGGDHRSPLGAQGGSRDVVYDVAMWGFPAGVVGGRLYFDLTSSGEVPPHWWGPFAAWDGGMGIWGGIALGTLVGIWRLRHLTRKLPGGLRGLLDLPLRVDLEPRPGRVPGLARQSSPHPSTWAVCPLRDRLLGLPHLRGDLAR